MMPEGGARTTESVFLRAAALRRRHLPDARRAIIRASSAALGNLLIVLVEFPRSAQDFLLPLPGAGCCRSLRSRPGAVPSELSPEIVGERRNHGPTPHPVPSCQQPARRSAYDLGVAAAPAPPGPDRSKPCTQRIANTAVSVQSHVSAGIGSWAIASPCQFLRRSAPTPPEAARRTWVRNGCRLR